MDDADMSIPHSLANEEKFAPADKGEHATQKRTDRRSEDSAGEGAGDAEEDQQECECHLGLRTVDARTQEEMRVFEQDPCRDAALDPVVDPLRTAALAVAELLGDLDRAT
jgi:hypothetical protein